MASFKNNFWIIVLLIAASGCVSKSEKNDKNILYKSDTFTVYSDSVVKGENKAVILSNKKITSNYKSASTKKLFQFGKF